MKSFSLIIFFLLLTSSFYLIAGESPTSNESVKFKLSVKLKSKKAGSSGELVFSLKPKDGIHITLNPPMMFKLDSTDAVTIVGDLKYSKSEKSEYLDASKPVRQSFTLSNKIKTGPLHVKGTLTYFYCSGTDGYCAKFKQPVDVVIKIVK